MAKEDGSWKSVGDMVGELQKTLANLRSGDIDFNEAHAETRIMNAALKAVSLQIDHAKMSKRIKDGADVLPDCKLG